MSVFIFNFLRNYEPLVTVAGLVRGGNQPPRHRNLRQPYVKIITPARPPCRLVSRPCARGSPIARRPSQPTKTPPSPSPCHPRNRRRRPSRRPRSGHRGGSWPRTTIPSAAPPRSSSSRRPAAPRRLPPGASSPAGRPGRRRPRRIARHPQDEHCGVG